MVSLLKIIYRAYFKPIKSKYFAVKYYHTLKVANSCDITSGIDYIGKLNTELRHPVGVVIGEGVILGENCIIYQNVTIGSKFNKKTSLSLYPRIGNNVIIGAGAIVVGDIEIGDNSIIGAGSVVFKSVPPNSVVAGNPSRIINK